MTPCQEFSRCSRGQLGLETRTRQPPDLDEPQVLTAEHFNVDAEQNCLDHDVEQSALTLYLADIRSRLSLEVSALDKLIASLPRIPCLTSLHMETSPTTVDAFDKAAKIDGLGNHNGSSVFDGLGSVSRLSGHTVSASKVFMRRTNVFQSCPPSILGPVAEEQPKLLAANEIVFPTEQPSSPLGAAAELPPAPSEASYDELAASMTHSMEITNNSADKLISDSCNDSTASKQVALQAASARILTRFNTMTAGDPTMRPREVLYNTRSVMSNRFELAFGMAIVTNAIMNGMEVQYMSDHIGQPMPLGFTVVRHLYTLLFLGELVSRMWVIGPRKFLCSSEFLWAWLDSFVVLTGLFEMGIDIWIFSMGTSSSKDIAGTGVFRNARLIRMVRVTRAFRLHRIIRFVSALRTLVYSIMATLRSLIWAMVLLGMIMYVFGLAFTMEALDFVTAEDPQGPNGAAVEELLRVWCSLDKSMFTLFQSISGGVSWRDVVWPLQEISIVPAGLFTVYIAFVCFAVLNVVTGVFCSSAIETTQRNPDLVARSIIDKKKACFDKLEQLFGAIDDDESGLITIDELEMIADDEMVKAYFQALEIDFSDAWTLFKLIDTTKDGTIKMDDFLQGCERLRGGATSMDMAEIGYNVKKLAKRVNDMEQQVKTSIEETKLSVLETRQLILDSQDTPVSSKPTQIPSESVKSCQSSRSSFLPLHATSVGPKG